MNNAELIKALRNCSDGFCSLCPFDDYELSTKECEAKLMLDASDALEAADKKIEELENDLLNGTISNIDRYKVHDYTVKDLILFAEMCKRNDVREADLKQAAWNLELAARALMNERIEIVKKWSDEMSNGISVRLIPDFEKAYEEMRGENDGTTVD